MKDLQAKFDARKKESLLDRISNARLLITLYKLDCDPTRVGNTHATMDVGRFMVKLHEQSLKNLERELENLNKGSN